MDNLQSKLAGLAKRHAALAGGEFEFLVRSIGEAKSKSEEDALVKRMITISKQQIKEGLSRKGENTKALKDLLVYLIYIDMLGHDTSWAAAAVIQLCSHKSLVVKKAAYLATSLLIDPSSELTIMVTATIQADLRSDNFLIVSTALQAISHCAGPELVTVFLPQVLAALRHDKDHVKKKALLALHRLLQLDSGIAPDVERHLIDKLGYKEPSVMVAALCGLHELARTKPAPYRNLVHYFTNILKQASEGKLGRGWDYHRAPAPFVQIELLRLLALLGAGDQEASSNMQAVIIEVWRRADALASTVGNALVFECAKTAMAMWPSDALLSLALQSAQRFLHSKDNNLKYAGIDILSRLVDGDSGRVEQHQLAIVECLRSADVTLKRKTLELLFKMSGPGNVEVVVAEVLAYLKEGGDDDAPRKQAAQQLVTVSERLAPSLEWFVETMIALLEGAADVAPAGAADALLRVVSEGTGGEDLGTDAALRRSAAQRCLALLDRAKLPTALLCVACWVLGVYGLQSGQSYEHVVDKLMAVLETQAVNKKVQATVAAALGKLAVRAGKPLPLDASEVLDTLARSECLEVQQVAAETIALVQAPAPTQKAVLPRDGLAPSTPVIDPGLPFLGGFVAAAEQAGAPPYLSLEDRVAMGVTRQPHTLFPTMAAAHSPGGLKFEAYETAQPAAAAAAAAPAAAGGASLFDDLDLGGLVITADAPPAVASPAPIAAAPPATEELRVNKAGGRRWGPSATPTPPPASPAARQQLQPTAAAASPVSSTFARPSPPPRSPPAPTVDPEQQRLAASLFGGAAKSSTSAGIGARPAPAAAKPKAPEIDLLGDAFSNEPATPVPVQNSNVDDLFSLDASFVASAGNASGNHTQPNNNNDPLAALSGLDIMSGMGAAASAPAQTSGGGAFGLDLLGGPSSLAPPQNPPPPAATAKKPSAASQDPFANLLG